jgi:hypothetical protein
MTARDGLLCAIGDHRYVVDSEAVSWQTVEVTRRGVDDGALDGEASLSNRVTWRRVRDNWIGGAGQTYADLIGDDQSSELRFFESSELDPWERRQLTIGRARRLFSTPVDAAHHRVVLTMNTDENIAVVDGDVIRTYQIDPRDGTETLVYTSPSFGADVDDAVVIGGDTIYAQLGGDIRRNDRSGVEGWTAFSTLETTFMADCKSRFIAANGNELFEVMAKGTKRTINLNCAENNWVWKGATPAPNAIYAWGDDGIRSEIFRLPLDEATGAISAPISAVELPVGELVTSMIVYLNTPVVGTNLGARIGTINGDGSLQLAGLLDELGQVRALAGAKEYVYVVTVTAPGLWRLNLDQFVRPFIPAFAAETVEVSGAAATSSEEQDIRDVTTAVVTDADGADPVVLVATVGAFDTYSQLGGVDIAPHADAGDIDMGWFTFGIGEQKSFDSVIVEIDPVPADSEYTVRVLVDTPTSTGFVNELFTPATGTTELKAVAADGDVRADRFRVRLQLTADTGEDTAPVIRRITLRATPVPFMSDEIELPLIVSDEVEGEHNQRVGMSVLAEWTYLLGLRDSRERVDLTIGGFTKVARVESVGMLNGGLGGGNGLDGFNETSEFWKGKWLVRLVTVDT